MKLDFSAVKEVVSAVAPTLGSCLGGPFGSVAGSLIASVLGGNPQDPQDLLSKIQSDPDYKLKLQQLEYQHAETLQQLANQQYATEVEDTKDARARQIEEEKITGKKDLIVPGLAFFLIFIYAIVQLFVIFNPDNQDDIISARLQDIVLVVVTYYFGSAHKR